MMCHAVSQAPKPDSEEVGGSSVALEGGSAEVGGHEGEGQQPNPTSLGTETVNPLTPKTL